MDEELKTAQEVAKATQETMKTGRAVIEAGSDLAKFVGKTLGTVPEDVVGLAFGDYLREIRFRNIERLARNTNEKLSRQGVENPEPIGPKLAIPLFEAASEETDETIQDMWASLLANAMGPSRDISLRQVFTSTLKAFEPIDVLLFKLVAKHPGEMKLRDIAGTLQQRLSLVVVSAQHLQELGCIDGNNRRPLHIDPTQLVVPTSLGQELSLATIGDNEE